MNTFATLAVFVACLAVGSCGGYNSGYASQPAYAPVSNYGQGGQSNGGAASAVASSGKPVEIIAGGPRYGNSEQLRPVLLESGYNAGQNHGQIAKIVDGAYNQHVAHGSYGPQRISHGRPRYSVQPAGATLLYPGQNNYRRYNSPIEYSKVVLPIRAAPPVAKLYVPVNNYGSQGAYHVEGPKY